MIGYSVKGLTFLITGAASGIGMATAYRLIEEGARVIAVDRTPLSENLPGKLENDYYFVQGDCSNPSVLNEAKQKIYPDRLDGIVLCAAEGPNHKDPVQVFRTNYIAVVENALGCETAMSEWSSIVFISSTAAFRQKGQINWQHLVEAPFSPPIKESLDEALKAISGKDAYSISKWALNQVVPRIARNFAQRHVRVNCLVPGLTRTPMSEYLWREDGEELAMFLADCPFGEFNLVEDVVNPILFLLSPQSRRITGSFIHVDGGWYAKHTA